MRILNTILDIVFPARCLACGKSGSDLCFNCLSESPSAERESLDWVFPLFDYRHLPVKNAVHLLKYKSKRGVAKIFAEALYGKILEELAELQAMENFNDAILIPIPLSRKRRRERGFNQAELICQELVRLNKSTDISHGVYLQLEENILWKPRDTEHQARITDRSKRLKNIIGSFTINPKEMKKVKGRNIILIDDVTTTGATLSEAKKVLKQAGAKKIIAFAVAH